MFSALSIACLFQESVATMVSVFASEMDFRGGWTIGVMMLKRDENCTFEVRFFALDFIS